MRKAPISHLLRPTFVTPPLAETNPADFMAALPSETRVISWDVDRTLLGQHERTIPDSHLRLLKELSAQGLRHCLNSNAQEARTPRVSFLAQSLGAALEQPVGVVTTHLSAVRPKPSIQPFYEAAALMGVAPSEMCHVGDQLLKDVLGARRAGYGASVLTPAFGEAEDHPLVHYVQRPAESYLLRRLGAELLLAGASEQPIAA